MIRSRITNFVFMQKANLKGKKSEIPGSSKSKENLLCPVSAQTDASLLIRVYAKPGSKHNSITGITEDGVGVAISAPPQGGAANSELCRFLTQVLGCHKRCVTLEKGLKSRNKVIKVSSDSKLSAEEVTTLIRGACSKV